MRMDVRIRPHALAGAVTPPPSKSMAHRLLLAPEADARQIGPEQILAEILHQVPAPRL